MSVESRPNVDDLPVMTAPGYPEVIGIELTSRCNLRCAMCGLAGERTASGRDPGPMSDAVFARAAEAGGRIGLVCSNGTGENFTDPCFLDRLEALDRRGVDTVFSTNGTLVTPEAAARLARLSRAPSVNVSLDSSDPDVYFSIRGRNQALALRGLAALAAEPRLAPGLSVSAIVWERALAGLSGLPALLSRFGVPTLVLQGLVPPGEGPERPAGSEGLTFVVAELRRECAERGIGVRVVPFLSWQSRGGGPAIWKDRPRQLQKDAATVGRWLPPTRQCGAPWEHVSVDKDGRVFPCCLAADRGEPFGSTEAEMGDLRSQTFDEVWSGERFRRFRRELLGGAPPAVCRSCPATSTGPHFFALYAARLVSPEPRAGTLRVVLENVGAATWTRRSGVRLGTTRRRDRSSALHTPRWLTPWRTHTFREEFVPPGASATFDVDARVDALLEGETFQALVEEVAWLPGTEFAVERAEGGLVPRPLRAGIGS